jgi:hypothetical protein
VTDFFKGLKPVKFEGPTSSNPLAYRFYNKDELVMGKRMEDHIRPAVAYWHTFAWEGGDPFGGRTFDRPWYDKGLEGAKIKADVAFELFDLLDAPFFCFHDADVAPRARRSRRATRTSGPSPTSSPRRCRARAPSCSGARPTCSATAATWPAPPPIPTRMCSPMPPAR